MFFRTTKGVTLTAEGQALFSYIEPAYNFIINGERKIAEMHQLMEGEIKIGAGDTLCKYYLLPYLEVFHEAYPDITIQVTNRTSIETINLLKEGKLDFGIVHLPVEDKKLNIIQSLQIEDCFIVGEKYKALTEIPHSLEQLSSYPLMLLERGASTRSNLDRFANQLGVELKPEIQLGSIDLLIEFARTGFGIAHVVKNFITEELAESQLYEIKLQELFPPRNIGIITLKDVPISAASKRFIDRLPQ